MSLSKYYFHRNHHHHYRQHVYHHYCHSYYNYHVTTVEIKTIEDDEKNKKCLGNLKKLFRNASLTDEVYFSKYITNWRRKLSSHSGFLKKDGAQLLVDLRNNLNVTFCVLTWTFSFKRALFFSSSSVFCNIINFCHKSQTKQQRTVPSSVRP